eukprot:725180-Prymnesium_polylepis.1
MSSASKVRQSGRRHSRPPRCPVGGQEVFHQKVGDTSHAPAKRAVHRGPLQGGSAIISGDGPARAGRHADARHARRGRAASHSLDNCGQRMHWALGTALCCGAARPARSGRMRKWSASATGSRSRDLRSNPPPA